MTTKSPAIEIHPTPPVPGAKFSILIPTWNNLEYLKLCVAGIRKHSAFPHQIIVHVNDGSDGTRQWVRDERLAYSHSRDNVGICYAMNIGRTLVQTDYILYMNDDMYVCPGWDVALWNEVARMNTKWFFLSATMLEPYPTKSTPVIAPCNCGTDTTSFDESRLLSEYTKFEKPDWCGATRPPTIVHKDMWDIVGGYSIEFSPGLYSDPDFSMKLWQAGVRDFKGVGSSRVYHFVSKSLCRIQANDGRKQFLKKWGITSSTFTRLFMRLGEPCTGPLTVDMHSATLKRALLKDRLKQMLLKSDRFNAPTRPTVANAVRSVVCMPV